MKVITTQKELQLFLLPFLKQSNTIGFVPTMGALHSGHISLIAASKNTCDITICSIFVNPTQFDKQEDFDKYPITIDEDKKHLEDANCDVLFLPSVAEIYPDGKDNYTPPNIGEIVNVLEGKHRIGHFQGVMQVVESLLRITTPTHLFMGLKDYQQFMVCTKMTEAVGIKVKMVGMPIIRENNGLAKSSRNVRLSEDGVKIALNISKRLYKTKPLLAINNIKRLEKKAIAFFESIEGLTVEYFEIVDRDTLMKPTGKQKKENLIALCAAWVEGVRLIDNLILSE
jgi:pantoate--beta-alanine ligase